MISFILNDRLITTDLAPSTPLIDFIRVHERLLGTKIGCREGDCGACTVCVGDLKGDELTYRTVTSCLMPLANAHRKHIVTIEGVNPPTGLNPIQQRFLERGATQCGFCTPGFIMALVGFALSKEETNLYNAIESVDGNICRCTGYKSINNAIDDIVKDLEKRDNKNPVAWLVKNNYIPEYFLGIKDRLAKIEPMKVNATGRIVGGGTDIYVEEYNDIITTDVIAPIAQREDLQYVKIVGDNLEVGAATYIQDFYHAKETAKAFPDFERQCRLMASEHIRNMATVAGNIANGGPIGDLSIIMMGMNASLRLNKDGQTRMVAMKDFFVSRKTTVLTEGEYVEAIVVPLPKKTTKFNYEKVSKRTYLDLAVVNSALRMEVENGIITEANYSVGGVGPIVIFLKKTCEYLIGKKICNETFKAANEIAQTEITPRSRADYKRLLVKTQMFNHFSKSSPDTMTLEALA